LHRFSALRLERVFPKFASMKQHQAMTALSVRLPTRVREVVEEEAERDRRPVANLIRNVIEDWVEQRRQQEAA
jgi:hypothetical protein